MHPRAAAHALTQLAAFLELRGESRFKVKAYAEAARALLSLGTDDLGALDRAGELAKTRGIGPATLAVLRDLIETGESPYLERLRAEIPARLIELLRVPGLDAPKIQRLHAELGVDSLDTLEDVARTGALAGRKGFGPKTVERMLKGIAMARSSGQRRLLHRAAAEAAPLLQSVRGHPAVRRADLAGALRRHCETIDVVEIVAATDGDPVAIADELARGPGVRNVTVTAPAARRIDFVDGARLALTVVHDRDFATALWLATGSSDHVSLVAARLAERGFVIQDDGLREAGGGCADVRDERALYSLAGLAWVPPERREGLDELDDASAGREPSLLQASDLRGILHCHSTWSDGKADIATMAAAAKLRGWSYIGITDHSQAAFYAGGLKPDQVREQHDEIDRLNETLTDFRVLKGTEADILTDGRLDYDDDLLDSFDFIVASVHSRFAMDRATMTARVLRALDDPRLTILGHPTGRLLLSREPYAIDMDAVLEKAATVGAAVELNADPHRLDLDWRLIPRARALGIPIEIGPDAHSTSGLDNVTIGVGMARKGGLRASETLNARSASEVLSFARSRRGRG